MSSLTILCFLLAVSSSLAVKLPGTDEEEMDDDEYRSDEFFGNYGSQREASMVYKQKMRVEEEEEEKESFEWRDCGGKGSRFHLVNLTISPQPLQLPGTAILSFNATVVEDLAGPIEAKYHVRKKTDKGWIGICRNFPGGCSTKDICSIKPTSAHLSPLAAASAAKENGYENEPRSSICPMTKGAVTLPPTSFSLPTEPEAAWYKITATFIKSKKRIACIFVKLQISKKQAKFVF